MNFNLMDRKDEAGSGVGVKLNKGAMNLSLLEQQSKAYMNQEPTSHLLSFSIYISSLRHWFLKYQHSNQWTTPEVTSTQVMCGTDAGSRPPLRYIERFLLGRCESFASVSECSHRIVLGVRYGGQRKVKDLTVSEVRQL